MENLIAALQIFLRYKNVPNPIFIYHCVMVINNISPKEVSDADKQTLKELGFYVDESRDCFKSNISVYC